MKDEIFKIVDSNPLRLRESYFINNYTELHSNIVEYTNGLDLPFKQRIWHYINKVDSYVLCNSCSNRVNFNKNWLDGYKKYCSSKCTQSDSLTKEKRKKTVLEKYGVDNIAKLDEIKKKQESTNLIKWGHKSTFQNQEVKEKWKNTVEENWGVDHISKVNYIKNKIKETNLNNWGVDHYSKTSEFKERVKKTNKAKYNKDWYTQSDEFKEKYKITSLNNWGVDHYSKTDEFKEKIKKTNFDNWGVDWFYQSDEFKEKVKKTNFDNFGVDHHMKSSKFKDILRELNYNNFGKYWYFQTDDFKEKNKDYNLNNWGVHHYSKTDEFKEKVKKTSLEKWGVSNYLKSEEAKDKLKESMILKYGVDNISKNEKYRKDNYSIAKDEFYLYYIDSSISLFRCDFFKDHVFYIDIDNYIKRKLKNIPLCTVCNPIGDSQSIKEKEIFEFIQSIYSGNIIQSYRDGLEIDIYLPEFNLGFEFNGLYWHSEEYKDKWYHLNKTNYFKERNIRIIHIWEDDWDFRKDIVKSQIRNWLSLTENRLFARKCEVREIVDSKSVTKFLNENHIQGSVRSNLKLGLYHEGELVSLMTFDHLEGRKKMSESEWNINRFCNKKDYNVIGGASKLFNYFLKSYNVSRVISYADRDWSIGSLYEKLGFDKVAEGDPDYKYLFEGRRIHKSRFRKSKTGITESKLSINKIWDCGKIKYIFNSNN